MTIALIKDACQTAEERFDAGDRRAALACLEAVAAHVAALPSPHHARMMWLVAMGWCVPEGPARSQAEGEALSLSDSDPDFAATGLFQLYRQAVESKDPAASRLGQELMRVVATAQGPTHPQVFEWQRRLTSLMDSSS